MARLKNVNSGAVVEVRDEKVEAMGSEWESAETKQAPAKKAAAKKSSDN
jgi:hypothetical protein